jgi:hypothetical protein
VKHLAGSWLTRVAFAVAAAAIGLVVEASADDWQGRKIPDISTNFIVGYGSLINSASRDSTAGAPTAAIPVRVLGSFGYIRSWNHHSPPGSQSGFTALGLRKQKPGERGVTINGVLYEAKGADMTKFDQREAGYVRVEVPLSLIEAVGWQRLPETGHFWVYVTGNTAAEAADGVADERSREPDADHPLLQSYIDVAIEGGLEYGPEFARELLDTTVGWSRFWLNDRELARRPWVHDPKAAAVDKELAGTPASAAFLTSRAFPEMYGERLRSGAAK